jgi:hypothetical protein
MMAVELFTEGRFVTIETASGTQLAHKVREKCSCILVLMAAEDVPLRRDELPQGPRSLPMPVHRPNRPVFTSLRPLSQP